MPKTQKNKKHKINQKKKALGWKIPPVARNVFLILVLVGICFFVGNWLLTKNRENQYPKDYAIWWKATLKLEQDSLDGKMDMNHAQDWLNASTKLIRWKLPFASFQELYNQVAKKPDKVLTHLESIRSIHQDFYQYHMRMGFTKPIFLADRAWMEWQQLKKLLQDNAHPDTIHESLQLLNLQIPILEPYWLRSDIADFTALNDSLEKLWLNQRFQEMYQLLLDNDAILTRACLDASY